jgi:LPXTG-motif cell wall-anchored protein
LCGVIKKLLLTALAGLLGLGLTAAPAHAAKKDPYVASVATHCAADSVRAVKRGNTFATHVEIQANGNRSPKGTVELSYTRLAGGFRATKSAHYPGHAIDVKSPALTKVGKYRIKTSFTPTNGSRFRACSSSYTVNVQAGLGPSHDGNPPGVGPNDDGNGILPNTGGPDLLWLLLALALLAGGAALVYVDRRRRRSPHVPRTSRDPYAAH